jgi:hypothetical protein
MPMRRICCGSCGLTQPNGRCAQSATPPSFMPADSSTSLARAIADGAAGTDPVLQLRADTSLRGPSRPNARPGRIPCKSHEIAPARSGLTISPGSAQDKPAIAIHRIQSPFRLHSSREFRDGGLRQQFLRRPVRNLAVRILGEPPDFPAEFRVRVRVRQDCGAVSTRLIAVTGSGRCAPERTGPVRRLA